MLTQFYTVSKQPPLFFNLIKTKIDMTKEEALNFLIKDSDTNKISDGYHTFGELYEHRITLFIALCRLLKYEYKLQMDGKGVWRSYAQSDGLVMDGWFILGISTVAGQQISYHLPRSKWEETEFACTLDKAPDWDGHTSDEVLKRLKNL